MTKIPRFLVAFSHEDPDRDYIVHTQQPRFIAVDRSESEEALEFEVTQWIDDAPQYEDQMQEIMDALSEAYLRTLEDAEEETHH